jgi:hypothetical protein
LQHYHLNSDPELRAQEAVQHKTPQIISPPALKIALAPTS